MYLEYQEAYVEPNATAIDGVDLSSSILINGSVNENQLFTYNVIYSVTDSDGNSVTEPREVIVRDDKASDYFKWRCNSNNRIWKFI